MKGFVLWLCMWFLCKASKSKSLNHNQAAADGARGRSGGGGGGERVICPKHKLKTTRPKLRIKNGCASIV